MQKKAEVFDRIHQDYIRQIAAIDLASRANRLGVIPKNNSLIIPFFTKQFIVSAKGIFDRSGCTAIHAINVILFKYVLLCPTVEPKGEEWVSYRFFKDAAPFVGGFLANVEKPISTAFESSKDQLSKACEALGGVHHEKVDFKVDLAMRFEALPRVPILLLFNDKDSEFKATCSVLFQQRAESFLDMECLAMLGWALAERLIAKADDSKDHSS